MCVCVCVCVHDAYVCGDMCMCFSFSVPPSSGLGHTQQDYNHFECVRASVRACVRACVCVNY